MARRRIKLKDLRKILRNFGVTEEAGGGKGSHIKFTKEFDDGVYSYPVPDVKDVLSCYVKGCRKKFRLTPEDGVSDDDFFGKA